MIQEIDLGVRSRGPLSEPHIAISDFRNNHRINTMKVIEWRAQIAMDAAMLVYKLTKTVRINIKIEPTHFGTAPKVVIQYDDQYPRDKSVALYIRFHLPKNYQTRKPLSRKAYYKHIRSLLKIIEYAKAREWEI
jgi:hypothetical protein